ncbi:Transcription-repair-coupling factor [Streptomyces griseomycini]
MDPVPALEEPLKKVLGPATAKVMAEHLGLHTVGDLLHHYPRRYEERGQLTHLADLPMDEHVTVVAQVAEARLHTFASAKAPRGKGQRLEVTITDGSGRLRLVFFGAGVHKPHKELLPGTRAMFAAGETDVLVATTVIEVGVNVPNATVMVIMDADRFGVSQLHQLRGRVGRGSAPGLCLLVTEMPEASAARQRLNAVASTLDGFELSRIDLEQRREGDVLGQAQSGTRSSLRMLAVIDDEEVIAEARREAAAVVAADPELERLPALRTALDALLDEEREQYLEKG